MASYILGPIYARQLTPADLKKGIANLDLYFCERTAAGEILIQTNIKQTSAQFIINENTQTVIGQIECWDVNDSNHEPIIYFALRDDDILKQLYVRVVNSISV